MTPKPSLRVLLLSDGRPGHFHLSEGIAAALARSGPVSITRLEVHRRRGITGHIAAGLIATGTPPRMMLRLAHGIDARTLPACDVIVSAGAETMPASVACARLLGVPNIFYGSLRRFRPQWFALSLTSYAEQAREPHPVMALKPSRLDPDTLPALTRTTRPRVAGLLIGGDGGGAVYGDSDWDGLISLLQSTHAAWGTLWIVSNSRRTPGHVSDRLATLAGGIEPPDLHRPPPQAAPRTGEGRPFLQRFVDVRTAGSGTLTDLFTAAEIVAVTTDSSSMLSEAIWSRRPALAVSPRRCILPSAEASYRGWLDASGWCRHKPIAEATPVRIAAALAEIVPLAHNPLDGLADLLRSKVASLAPR